MTWLLTIAAVWVGLAVANWWIMFRPERRIAAALKADRQAQDALGAHYETAVEATKTRHPTAGVTCACGTYQGLKPDQAVWTGSVTHEKAWCWPARERV